MLLLTPLYGLTGVALSVLISHFFILFSRIVYSNSFVTIKNYMYYVILIIIYIGFTINLFYGRDYKYQIYVVLWIVTFLASKKELTMLIYQLKDRLSWYIYYIVGCQFWRVVYNEFRTITYFNCYTLFRDGCIPINKR